MELRFKFDTVEVNNPVNWRDITIRYERDEVVRGLFTTYTSVLRFTGAAYDAFMVARNDQLCAKIDVDIDIRCSRFASYETLLSGVILVQDSSNQDCGGFCEVTIEQNDVNHFFFNNKDFGVDVDGSNSIISSPTWQDLTLFNIPNGSTTNLPIISYGAPIDDLLKFILSENGSRMGFYSELFATTYTSQVITIDFTVAPAAGDTIDFRVTDEWGHNHIFQCEANASARTTWQNFEKVLLLSNDSDPTKAMGEAADVTVSNPVGPVRRRFEITFHFQTTIVSLSVGTGSATATTTTDFQFGLDHLRYADSSSIRASISEWYILSPGRGACAPGKYKRSFDDIFNIITPSIDVSMGFYNDGGTWKVQVETAEYFLGTTSTLTIRNVKGIIESYNEEVFGDKILLSYVNNENAPGAPNAAEITELSYNLPDFDCDDQLDRRSEAYINEGLQIQQDAKALIDPDSDYLIMSDGDVGAATQWKYRVYDKSATSFVDNYYYNIPIGKEAQILRNRYTLPAIEYYEGTYTKAYTSGGGFVYTSSEPSATITEGDGFAPVRIQFEKNISFTDFKTISASQQITVNEGESPADDFDCFIEKVEYRVMNGVTTFELSTKDQ